MKTQYTPGPWQTSPYAGNHDQDIYRSDGTSIALTRGGSVEAKANARLIALAPEMAEALRDVLGFLEDMAEDYSDYGIPEKRDRVRSLLSRLD